MYVQEPAGLIDSKANHVGRKDLEGEGWGRAREIKSMRVALQHDDSNDEARLSLVAIALDLVIARDRATLRDVPWRAIVAELRVADVGCSLVADGDGVESDEDAVHDDGDERCKDMHHVQDHLGEQ